MRFIALAATILLAFASAFAQSDPSLPDGFKSRAANETDGDVVHALCPMVKWHQVFFPCYEDDWAVWAVNAQKARLEGLTPTLHKEFTHQNLLTVPADQVVYFPDGSVFLVATASVKYGVDEPVVTWIFSPGKRTLDMIWEHGGTITYMGPHARVLRDSKIIGSMFKMDPGAAPTD
jgi:hypothetical protein